MEAHHIGGLILITTPCHHTQPLRLTGLTAVQVYLAQLLATQVQVIQAMAPPAVIRHQQQQGRFVRR